MSLQNTSSTWQDFSISKNVFAMLLAFVLLLLSWRVHVKAILLLLLLSCRVHEKAILLSLLLSCKVHVKAITSLSCLKASCSSAGICASSRKELAYLDESATPNACVREIKPINSTHFYQW